jgi:hypothetical protein
VRVEVFAYWRPDFYGCRSQTLRNDFGHGRYAEILRVERLRRTTETEMASSIQRLKLSSFSTGRPGMSWTLRLFCATFLLLLTQCNASERGFPRRTAPSRGGVSNRTHPSLNPGQHALGGDALPDMSRDLTPGNRTPFSHLANQQVYFCQNFRSVVLLVSPLLLKVL